MRTTLKYQAAPVLVLAAAFAGSLPNANAAEQVKPIPQSAAKTAASHVRPLASIELYNPTPWTEPVAVEVPVGRIATPGVIDWAGVRLMLDGKELAFAIREGRVHWKSRLTAPVPQPRAEDLLVFSLPLPRGVWIRVEIIPGRPATGSALTRASGVCTVSYPNLMVAIDEASATLASLSVSGKPLLAGPLELGLYAVEDGTMAFTGPLGCSYDSPTLTIKKGAKLKAPQARLASSSSSLALTELNFVIEPDQGPMLAVTYRIHPSGLIEVISDERPWQGRSPWLDFAVEFNLNLAGAKQLLPLLQTRHPFYGFKDYSAPVRLAGALYQTPQAQVLEFGEETINGRRWARQLYIDKRPDSARTKGLVEMVSEGPIVQVTPVSTPLPQAGVQVNYPEDSKAAAETLVKALTDCGLPAQLGGSSAPSGETCLVTLRMAADPQSEGLEGDGFSIRRDRPGQEITILAGTRLGLLRGVLKAAEHLRCNPAANEGSQDNAGIGPLAPLPGATGRGSDFPAAKTLPLIAGNPAVDVRGGGFGGGNHEVDFPYDTEAEWKRVFDNLLASGMNKFTCLGMWGNWKLPALYKYMPELRSTAPDAYDEVSGAKFTEFELHREKGLRLIQYLHDRGAKVWLWIPVGCVPTTFAARYPEAMCTGSQKVPRIMHPKYRQYLDAYFREILETYPLDGFMLVRDDNGGLDQSAEYQSFLETSRTKDPAWEQYLLIYDLLRNKGFQGTVMVYPYYDLYAPRLDPLVPKDFFMGGHGSGMGMLTRDYETLGPMGDTWIDNLYTSFRVAPTPRMKRLLADRGSYWIGGAYWGTELPWEAVGYFGWQPTATVNTFRYDWGLRMFGVPAKAVDFASFSSAYENLWDIYNTDLLPYNWQLKLSPAQRTQAAESGRTWLGLYRERLQQLQPPASDAQARWLAQVSLYGTFFEYSLRRLELHTRLFELVTPYKAQVEASQPLPADVRQSVTAVYQELYRCAKPFAAQTKLTPGDMLRATEPMTSPYKEWVAGFNGWLEAKLDFKQFAGSLNVSPLEVAAGQPFELTVELANRGVCPWIPGVGHRLLLEGDFKKLGLPETVDLAGEWVLPGDKRRLTLKGSAPATSGQSEFKISFVSPFYLFQAVMDNRVQLVWK